MRIWGSKPDTTQSDHKTECQLDSIPLLFHTAGKAIHNTIKKTSENLYGKEVFKNLLDPYNCVI